MTGRAKWRDLRLWSPRISWEHPLAPCGSSNSPFHRQIHPFDNQKASDFQVKPSALPDRRISDFPNPPLYEEPSHTRLD